MSYQFLHYTFHEFLVAINLFIKREKGLNRYGVQQINITLVMLAGLYGVFLGSSKSMGITKQITKAVAYEVTHEVTLIEVADILENCGPCNRNYRMCASLMYEYQSSTLKLKQTVFIQFDREETNEYYKRAIKYFLEMCKKGEVWIQEGVFYSGEISDEYSVVLSCFNQLSFMSEKWMDLMMNRFKPNESYSRIFCRRLWFETVNLLNFTDYLAIGNSLTEDEFVSLINELLSVKEKGIYSLKNIEFYAKNFTETHYKKLEELKESYKRRFECNQKRYRYIVTI